MMDKASTYVRKEIALKLQTLVNKVNKLSIPNMVEMNATLAQAIKNAHIEDHHG